MEIKSLLEKAKELLIRDKKLLPVLIIEKENGEVIVAGLLFEDSIDRIQAMMKTAKRFAEDDEQIKILSLIGDTYITRVDLKGKVIKKDEAIVVSRIYVDTGKKEIIIQTYEKSGDNIIWKELSQELDDSRFYLLEAFVQGYETEMKRKTHCN